MDTRGELADHGCWIGDDAGCVSPNTRCLGRTMPLPATDRVAAGQNGVDEGRNVTMMLSQAVVTGIVGMRRGGIHQDPDDSCSSAIHVNRVLSEPREGGLVTFKNGHVTFQDFNGLIALADFETACLDHDGPLLI